MTSLIPRLLGAYGGLLALGAVTAITDHRRLNASPGRIFLLTLLFPFYMATYLPLVIASFFTRPAWHPIEHRGSRENVIDKSHKL